MMCGPGSMSSWCQTPGTSSMTRCHCLCLCLINYVLHSSHMIHSSHLGCLSSLAPDLLPTASLLAVHLSACTHLYLLSINLGEMHCEPALHVLSLVETAFSAQLQQRCPDRACCSIP